MVKIGCFYTNLFLLEAIFPKEAHNTIIFRRVNIQAGSSLCAILQTCPNFSVWTNLDQYLASSLCHYT